MQVIERLANPVMSIQPEAAASRITLHTLHRFLDAQTVRVEYPADGRRAVVKEPLADAENVAEVLAREYDFMATLDHARLLKPIGFDDSRGAAHYEDAQCTLGQLLRQSGPMPVDLVVNVLHWTASALDYLHERNLGHCGLSLDALFADVRGQVKFAPFTGFVFRREPPHPALGLLYQAPEVLTTGLGAPTPTSDLYSLGFVALQLLSGPQFESLFGLTQQGDGANWLGWHADPQRALDRWEDAVPHVPGALKQIVDGLIVKNPAQRRFKTARQLLAELENFQMETGRRLPTFKGGGGVAKKRKKIQTGTRKVEPQPLSLTHVEDNVVRRFSPNRSVMFGRQSDCEIVLKTSGGSSKHAYLVHMPDGWWILDLRSRTGVQLNGNPVHRARLKAGDSLTVGGEKFAVSIGTDASPQRFGEFELLEALHRGGRLGDLYKAKWTADGKQRTVALRIFSNEFRADEAQIKRFLRGIPKAAEFKHPHILRLYRGGIPSQQGHGRLWLAMEYMAGGSLRDQLAKQSPMPISSAVQMGVDIATALGQAEKLGVVHRNIHPSAILFDENGRAKLGDFTMLRGVIPDAADDITRTGAAIGEFAYQPPEQIAGKPVDGRADLYSLAACIYQAVCGKPPFDPNAALPQIFSEVTNTAPVSPRKLNPAVPAALEKFLTKALAKTAIDRYQTAEEFRTALAACG
jgi:serine/threonine protein kinase